MTKQEWAETKKEWAEETVTKMAAKVTVIHRRHELRASKVMQQRALANPKIAWAWNQEVVEVLGDKKAGVTGVKTKDTTSGEMRGSRAEQGGGRQPRDARRGSKAGPDPDDERLRARLEDVMAGTGDQHRWIGTAAIDTAPCR